MCCAVATSGWVKGMSYTLGSPTLASSPSPNDITLVRGHIPAVLSVWPKTVDILGGLCETVSLCVRSLAGNLSTRACSVVTNHWAKEAVVECKELLPLLLSVFAGGA